MWDQIIESLRKKEQLAVVSLAFSFASIFFLLFCLYNYASEAIDNGPYIWTIISGGLTILLIAVSIKSWKHYHMMDLRYWTDPFVVKIAPMTFNEMVEKANEIAKLDKIESGYCSYRKYGFTTGKILSIYSNSNQYEVGSLDTLLDDLLMQVRMKYSLGDYLPIATRYGATLVFVNTFNSYLDPETVVSNYADLRHQKKISSWNEVWFEVDIDLSKGYIFIPVTEYKGGNEYFKDTILFLKGLFPEANEAI